MNQLRRGPPALYPSLASAFAVGVLAYCGGIGIDLIVAVGTAGVAASGWVALLHARTMSRMQLRAYVTVRVDDPDWSGDGPSIQWNMYIKNAGQTPATGINVWFICRRMPLGEEGSLQFPISIDGPSSEQTLRVLGPGEEFRQTGFFNRPTPAELVEIQDMRGESPFIYGTVRYRDVFGDDQYTNFCYWLVWLESQQRWHVAPGRGDGNSAT
ncbi:MAG TPA: hypothetical protein PL091_15600 [Actinomycetota bacterium]|nr:hypothetical protein [Actinomycetota bacterium]